MADESKTAICQHCAAPKMCEAAHYCGRAAVERRDAERAADPAKPTGCSPISACTWCSADYSQLADRLEEAGWAVQPPGTGAAAEIERLRAALDHIRLECEATHTGQERAYTALSRIDGIARRALA